MKFSSKLILFICILFLLILWFVFSIPDSPKLISVQSPFYHVKTQNKRCVKTKSTALSANNLDVNNLDDDGKLTVTVWNLYKQQNEGWDELLTKFASQSQLLLLQEASLTDELVSWISQHKLNARYVDAFEKLDVSSGVLNLSVAPSSEACAYAAAEPLTILPKSGLYAVYPLSNGASLAVINLHALNFTLGTKNYKQQLDDLIHKASNHQGPLIVAGDLNTWSEDRLEVVNKITQQLGLKEAILTPDYRRLFINDLPLDHLYYRGLTLEKGTSYKTKASDHNPIQVSFSL